MAEISFSIDEIVRYINEYVDFPEQIKDLSAAGDKVKIECCLSKVFPPITVYLRFHSYRDGEVLISVEPKLISGFLPELLKTFNSKLNSEVFSSSENIVEISLDSLISQTVKGIGIKNICFDSDSRTFSTEIQLV